jgi:hypothetical protein
MRIILLFVFGLVLSTSYSQSSKEKMIDMGLAAGNTQGSLAVAFIHNWRLGEKQRFSIGTGARLTAYLGKNQNYITAPAQLTSGKTGLGVIFTENIEANLDTMIVKTSQVNSLNLLINLGYRLSEKLSVAFNIDAIGFSFGAEQNGNYMNGPSGQNVLAKPTGYNLLLTSDNDLGSLNSEFALRYQLNEKWNIKGGLQFLFTEFTTSSEVQQFPSPNDRFRNKSAMLSIGAGYLLK